MTDSILETTKKTLSIESTYTAFDEVIILHINSVFSTLNQLGIGPATGFAISDDTAVWDDFLHGDNRMNAVKTYMYLRVRLLFDPPTTGYHVDAMKEQIKELEWRLNVVREGDEWMAPTTKELVLAPGRAHWWDLTGLTDFPSGAAIGDYGYDTTTNEVFVNTATNPASQGYWWDLTGGIDFPPQAAVGDYGFDLNTGDVWRKTG